MELSFSFFWVDCVCHLGRGDHRLELWKIKGTLWEECPTVGSPTLLWGYVFSLRHTFQGKGNRNNRNILGVTLREVIKHLGISKRSQWQYRLWCVWVILKFYERSVDFVSLGKNTRNNGNSKGKFRFGDFFGELYWWSLWVIILSLSNFLSFNVQVHELFYVSGYVSAYLSENQFHESWECVL